MLSLFTFLHQEEIPFSQFEKINEKLPQIIVSVLEKYNIVGKIKTSVLSCYVAFEVVSNQGEFIIKKQIIKGPSKNAPQRAIDGFLRKYNLNLKQCEIDEKNNIVFILPEKTLTANEISTRLVGEILEGMQKVWTQLMPSKYLEWIRPINGISAFCNDVCVYGEKLENFPQNWQEFENWCEKNKVIASYNDRKNYIINEVEKVANENGFSWQKNVVSELACLYGSPKLCITTFDEKYLELPQEVLRLTIEKNQRYILFYKDEKIQNTIGIIGKIHNEITTKGHLKTIRARLDDASYYIEKDLKNFNKESTEQKLQDIMFHQKYGSVAKRIHDMLTMRVPESFLVKDTKLIQAIKVCKNDLVSHTVQDFTELQGLMGGFYLEKLGIKKEICDAVAEHYKPLNPNDSLPKTVLGLKLSFVDKLQKINALASVDEVPTSSRDPFAIRRDISSIIRICREKPEIFGIKESEILEFLQGLIDEKLHYFVKERL